MKIGRARILKIKKQKRSISHLLYDLFTTDDTAPLNTPRACEPGPGTLTALETDGSFAISGGKMIFTAQTTPVFGDQNLLDTLPRSRIDSPAFVFTLNLDVLSAGKQGVIGWSTANAATREHCFYPLANGTVINIYSANSRAVGTYTAGVDYKMAVVLRPTAGAFYIVQGGTQYPDPTLIWVDNIGSEASLYAGLVNYDLSGNMDEMKIYKALGSWGSDYGMCTGRIASPTTGDSIAHTANGMVDIKWTPAANEILDLMVRYTDDGNCWIVRCDQTAGTIKLFEKTTGTETQRATAAQTLTAGVVVIVRAVFYENTIKAYTGITNNGGIWKWTYTSAAFQRTAVIAKCTGFSTAVNFQSWPRTVTFPFDFTIAPRREFFTVGDSKTAYYQYQPILITNLIAGSGYKIVWQENPATLSYSNETIALMAGRIDAELATRTGNPIYILLNFGANDVISLPAEVTWKANYYYVLDALHAKYPYAQMYIMRAWRRGQAAECDILAAWIDDIVVSRSFAHLGPDERVFIENGDDGVTYTDDGIHPNTAGYILVAAQWQTSMGL